MPDLRCILPCLLLLSLVSRWATDANTASFYVNHAINLPEWPAIVSIMKHPRTDNSYIAATGSAVIEISLHGLCTVLAGETTAGCDRHAKADPGVVFSTLTAVSYLPALTTSEGDWLTESVLLVDREQHCVSRMELDTLTVREFIGMCGEPGPWSSQSLLLYPVSVQLVCKTDPNWSVSLLVYQELEGAYQMIEMDLLEDWQGQVKDIEKLGYLTFTIAQPMCGPAAKRCFHIRRAAGETNNATNININLITALRNYDCLYVDGENNLIRDELTVVGLVTAKTLWPCGLPLKASGRYDAIGIYADGEPILVSTSDDGTAILLASETWKWGLGVVPRPDSGHFRYQPVSYGFRCSASPVHTTGSSSVSACAYACSKWPTCHAFTFAALDGFCQLHGDRCSLSGGDAPSLARDAAICYLNLHKSSLPGTAPHS